MNILTKAVIAIKYKQYGRADETLTPMQQVLQNRGIPVQRQTDWLCAWKNDVNDWRLLDEEKIAKGIEVVQETIFSGGNICVCVDCDVDGFTSAAIFINYLHTLHPDYVEKHVHYVLHEGKTHGFADTIGDILACGPSLVVAPDGASNDLEQQKTFNDAGIKVLILDHHLCDKDYSNDMTTIINNQLCDYPNKHLVGAGVVWQFFRGWEESCEDVGDYTAEEDFSDLAALGQIGDMSDYRDMEVRAIVNLGITRYESDHGTVKNDFLRAILEKNTFILNKRNGANYLGLAFAAVPFVNAICRSGTMDEKRLVFEAFLAHKQHDLVESSKRGEKGKMVERIEEALTVLGRVKRRQSELQDEAVGFFKNQIEEKHLTDNAIITCVCGEDLSPSLLGLVANKIQAKYQHPALVLRRVEKEDGAHLMGSARNYSYCPIEDMRQLCEDTGLVDYAQGHSSAYGLSMPERNLPAFMNVTNKAYEGISFSPVYHVDYVWEDGGVDPSTVLDIASFTIYGQNVPESMNVVKDIDLSRCSVQLLSPDRHPTIKVRLPCGVDLIKFGSSQKEFKEFASGSKRLTVVGTCAKNEYMGNVTPQIQVKDYELSEADEDDLWVF